MPVDLSAYNTVAMRIAEFRQKHPEGSLQPVNHEQPFQVLEFGGKQFVTYTAAAYRTPDDPRPGIGVAWEPFPGKTPYTRDSELMNAETSAWGRAIVAVLAADTVAGIATREEIENRRADQEGEAKPVPRKVAQENGARLPTADLNSLLKTIAEATTTDALNAAWKSAGAAGVLQTETVIPSTGEKLTIQNYLYQRADAVKSGASTNGAAKGKAAAAK